MSYTDQKQICLVTGGARGFLGQNLVAALLKKGYCVRVFDISPAQQPVHHPNCTYQQGDLRNYADVLQACQGIHIVFHVASMIIASGILAPVQKEELYDVNVLGTRHIIQACLECQVQKLVYTSSNNVVLDKPIAGGDESLPYAATFIDHYTKSKVLAEQAVLAANGKGSLLTCALRPGGIYGPGDPLFLPKVLDMCRGLIPLCRIGDGSALADNIYVDDLAEAHILAAEKMHYGSIVCGQAYFISDGDPANYFDFIQLLLHKLEKPMGKGYIPYPLAYAAGYVCEWIDAIKIPSRILSRIGVVKLAAHNYFSIHKARKELGFSPQISKEEGLTRCLPYCRQLLSQYEAVERPQLVWWAAVLGGMALLAVLAWGWDVLALKILFNISVLVHAAEAVYAYGIASKAGLKTARGWFVQTFLLGYPSLRLLINAKRKKLKTPSYE